MTLAVACIEKGQIAIVADTLLTEHNNPLPIKKGTIKICILPGNACIAFSGSPELAERDINEYINKFSESNNFGYIVRYFEYSSKNTGNEYLLAFGKNPKIIKITNGKKHDSISTRLWIGDKDAYEKFLEFMHGKRKSPESGRALTATLFGDEPEKSKVSDIYNALRRVASDASIKSVGGFITAVSSRGLGFRFSLYSDLLYDWPHEKSEEEAFTLDEKIVLSSSGENHGFSTSQICSLFMNANYVAYYLLSGRMLYIFYGSNNGLATKCHVQYNISPDEIKDFMTKLIGLDLHWMVWVFSATNLTSKSFESYREEHPEGGIGLGLFCHANTCPKDSSIAGILVTKNEKNLMKDVAELNKNYNDGKTKI